MNHGPNAARVAPRRSSESGERAPRRGASGNKGPRLGVAKRRRVVTAGGRVGQWWTPRWCADLFARWVGVEGLRVLDAGAGAGALSISALRHGARFVAVLERDPKWQRRLEAMPFPRERSCVLYPTDFLTGSDPRQLALDVLGPAADVVVSNPPWEGRLPELFMLRAVEIAPRACFIVPLNILSGKKRQKIFRASLEPLRAHALDRRPIFAGLTGGMRDVCFLEVRKRLRPLPDHVPVRFPLTVGAL